MSRGQPSPSSRQESHRIYLQHYLKDNESSTSNVATLKTKSTAVRLTSTVSAKDVCSLLRQKFGLPSNPYPFLSLSSSLSSSSYDNHAPLVHRIHARLNQVRQNSTNSTAATATCTTQDANNSHESRKLKRKQRKKELLECQSKEDLLVMVISCSLPKGYVQFEHEYDDRHPINTNRNNFYPQHHESSNTNVNHTSRDNTGAGGTSTKEVAVASTNNLKITTVTSTDDNSTSLSVSNTSSLSPNRKQSSSTTTTTTSYNNNNNISIIDREPFNIVETLLSNENPLQKQDEMIAYINQLQDKVENARGDKSGKGIVVRKAPVIHWFFIPSKITNDAPKATVVVDGYCTDADDEDSDDDDDDEDPDDDECSRYDDEVDDKQSNNKTFECSSPWKKEVEAYHTSRNKYKIKKSRVHKERHQFTVLSSFESTNGSENFSGFLLKQSPYDKQVWKKVHCVLAENQFWYVSRVKKIGKNHGSRIGKHGIIDLNASMLQEPTSDSPLAGFPNTFQLITRNGEVHSFQAGNNNAFMRWCQCLSERMLLWREYSTFTLTDSIITKEMKEKEARFERFLLSSSLNSSFVNKIGNTELQYLVTLAMQIAEYKERCKQTYYIYSLLVLSSKNENEIKPSQNSNNNDNNKHTKNQSELLYQSFAIFNSAESIMQLCQKIIINLTKNRNKDVVDIDILEGQNEIHSCLRNFQQHQKDHMHGIHNESVEASLQKLLLPEALFDKYFECVVLLAKDIDAVSCQ